MERAEARRGPANYRLRTEEVDGCPGRRTRGRLMYSTCIYCHQPLGTNEVIEQFPVGRRLAFDRAKGRLWVVCKACERWNLSPLETRWEAIEACEERFLATRLRVSTDNIGLARLREGLELVRIGEPKRPEFAAWRYGDQFGRRRRRALWVAGGVTVAVGAVMVGASAAGIGIGGFGGFWGNLPGLLRSLRVIKVKTANGELLKIRGSELNRVALFREANDVVLGWGRRRPTFRLFRGEEALRLAGQLLPAINYSGGTKAAVTEAVRLIEYCDGSAGYLASAIPRGSADPTGRAAWLGTMKAPVRLGLEMALHEEAERRAIEGELELLEEAWREAEEIAGIADDLLVSPAVEAQLAELKQQARKETDE